MPPVLPISGPQPKPPQPVKGEYLLHHEDPQFQHHVDELRSTMFYVCQGSCLCGTVNNRGKVIYCYGDLVPRHGELFADGGENQNGASSKDLLAAQLGVWSFGIIALLIVLLLIRKSIVSMRRHLERLTDRLPIYHDDEVLSTNSTTSPSHSNKTATGQDHKETSLDNVVSEDHFVEDSDHIPLHESSHRPNSTASGHHLANHHHHSGGYHTKPLYHHHNDHRSGDHLLEPTAPAASSTEDHHDLFSEDGTLTPDPDMIDESPIHIGIHRLAMGAHASKNMPVESLRKMRLQRRDFKKGGEALRGKNVTENFRVKEKDIKRTMK